MLATCFGFRALPPAMSPRPKALPSGTLILRVAGRREAANRRPRPGNRSIGLMLGTVGYNLFIKSQLARTQLT